MGVESYQDQLSIETPEHVALRLPVAGIGSRFLAIFLDTLIQVVAYVLFIVGIALLVSDVPAPRPAAGPSSRMMAWTIAFLIFLHFLAFWGYFTLFEGLWRGQTPGKRVFKLRVLKDSGRQITFAEAMTRNLLRLMDALPSMYLVGVIAMLCNRQRKRLGDLAAGTIVVHEEELGDPGSLQDVSRTITAGFYSAETLATVQEEIPRTAFFPATVIAKLGVEDLVMLDTFFARIPDLEAETKEVIASRMLRSLCAKMEVAEPSGVSARLALDEIAYELRNQTGLASR